jgi:hypothetical protein
MGPHVYAHNVLLIIKQFARHNFAQLGLANAGWTKQQR